MTQGIAEPDWQRFRQLHPVALERFCQKILSEIESINADDSNSFHQRYLDVYKVIERRDKVLSNTFDDLRRSSALTKIISIYGRGLLTEVELGGFGQEVVNVVKSLINE